LTNYSTNPKNESADVTQKKLITARQELEEMKQKFGALKRNFESVSHYASKDH